MPLENTVTAASGSVASGSATSSSKPQAQHPVSGLFGRATTGQNSSPRAGFCSRLREIFRDVVRHFSCGEPRGARLAREVPARTEALLRRLQAVMDGVHAPTPLPEHIARDLKAAVEAAEALERAGGSADSVLRDFCNRADGREIEVLLEAVHQFQGQHVARAQTLLKHDDLALGLLMNIEQALLVGIDAKLPSLVYPWLDQALGNLRAECKGPIVGNQMHAAFESLRSLQESGVLGAAADQTADEIVYGRLSVLAPEEFERLLPHLHPEDFARLSLMPFKDEARAAIDKQLAARASGTRRAEAFRDQARELYDRCPAIEEHDGGIKFDPCQALQDIVRLAGSLEALKTQCRSDGTAIPPNIWQIKDSPYPESTKDSELMFNLAGIVSETLAPAIGGIDPTTLEPQELMDICGAMRSLCLQDRIERPLRQELSRAQEQCLQQQRETFRSRFGAFAIASTAAAYDPTVLPQMLQALAQLEEAARQLQKMYLAFHPSELPEAVAAARDAAHAAQAAIIQIFLKPQSGEALRALAEQFGSPDCQGLRSALHVGANLASVAQDTALQERFAGMARLYELIAEQVATPSGASSSGAPPKSLEEHRWFAAENLPVSVRDAFRDTYGLVFRAGDDPSLRSEPTGAGPGSTGEE